MEVMTTDSVTVMSHPGRPDFKGRCTGRGHPGRCARAPGAGLPLGSVYRYGTGRVRASVYTLQLYSNPPPRHASIWPDHR